MLFPTSIEKTNNHIDKPVLCLDKKKRNNNELKDDIALKTDGFG